MKVVTEETLNRALLWTEKQYHPLIQWFLDHGTEELNPWLPIDENTPKDKELLILYCDKTKAICTWHKDMGFDIYDDWESRTITATHYQELPDDPE